jgi:hypothetical protein
MDAAMRARWFAHSPFHYTIQEMSLLRDQCVLLFQNDDIKRDVQCLLKSVISIIYNEIYPYLVLICIYSGLILILILGILFLLLRVPVRNSEKFLNVE